MGRTILDLFQSKVLSSSGKTAEETYDIRNSKDIPISSRNGLINTTAIPAINLVRKDVGVRTSETRLEQELVGLRPLTQLSSPFIYGTAILRITQQKSDQTEQMKQATGGNVGGSGVIGGLLERAGDGVRGGLRKVGVKFPSQLNPTTYAEQLAIEDKSTIPSTLSKIKGNASGNIAGKILSQPQTPNQLVRNAAGSAVGFVKNQARGFLFGERSTTGFAVGSSSGSLRNPDPLSTTINYGSSTVLNTAITPYEGSNRIFNASGTSYSKTITTPLLVEGSFSGITFSNVNVPFWPLPVGTQRRSDEGELSLANKTPDVKLQDFTRSRVTLNDLTKYSDILKDKKTLAKNRGFRERTRILNGRAPIDSSISFGDELNQSPVFNSEVNEGVEGLNFIPLKFTLLSNSKTIYFRSTIDGISETFSPSWDSSKFVGNPFSFYTYTGVERSVSFNLKVAATTPSELKRNWERLSFLSSMVYPAGYQDETYVTPPFIKFTLGNIYKAKEGFIESLSYSFDDQMGWEIGNDDDMKEYKLPKKIDVTIGIKFLENRSNTDNHTKLYSFTPVSQ
jgi:hypothetical protein